MSPPVSRTARISDARSRLGGWPAYFSNAGLGFEKVNLARPAIHEELDDSLSSRRIMPWLRLQVVRARGCRRERGIDGENVVSDQVSQSRAIQPVSHT